MQDHDTKFFFRSQAFLVFVALKNSSSPIKRFHVHTKSTFVCFCLCVYVCLLGAARRFALLSNRFRYYSIDEKKAAKEISIASDSLSLLMIAWCLPVSKSKLICLF